MGTRFQNTIKLYCFVLPTFPYIFVLLHINGLVLDYSNSIANTLEFLKPCTKPLVISTKPIWYVLALYRSGLESEWWKHLPDLTHNDLMAASVWFRTSCGPSWLASGVILLLPHTSNNRKCSQWSLWHCDQMHTILEQLWEQPCQVILSYFHTASAVIDAKIGHQFTVTHSIASTVGQHPSQVTELTCQLNRLGGYQVNFPFCFLLISHFTYSWKYCQFTRGAFQKHVWALKSKSS